MPVVEEESQLARGRRERQWCVTEKLNRNKDSVLFLAKSRWSAIRKASSRWKEGQGKREQRLPFQRAREKNVCGRENECGTCIRRCANESAPILLRSRIVCICSSLSSPAQPTFSRGSDLSSISSSFLPPKKNSPAWDQGRGRRQSRYTAPCAKPACFSSPSPPSYLALDFSFCIVMTGRAGSKGFMMP